MYDDYDLQLFAAWIFLKLNSMARCQWHDMTIYVYICICRIQMGGWNGRVFLLAKVLLARSHSVEFRQFNRGEFCQNVETNITKASPNWWNTLEYCWWFRTSSSNCNMSFRKSKGVIFHQFLVMNFFGICFPYREIPESKNSGTHPHTTPIRISWSMGIVCVALLGVSSHSVSG